MSVSIRQRMILEILLLEEQEITIGEIAERIEVSTRTIHRELPCIEGVLKEYDLELVKKSGIGIQIQGDVEDKEALRYSLFNLTTTEYTPNERKAIILCALLETSEPLKLISLAIDLKVTTATISHDLDDLETWLIKYDLTLLRKRGYGVEIQGSESAKRRVMSSLIAENLDEHDLLSMIKENIHNKSVSHIDTVSERLLGLIEKEKLVKVEKALQNIDEELPYPLADSAYIGLVIHLALAIERIEKGERITFDEKTLESLKSKKEYRIAERIITRLQQIFSLEIPVAEVGYVTMHLRGAKIRSSQEETFWSGNVELMAQTQRLISLCEEKINVPLKQDTSLYQGLLTHMEPALYRIRGKMKIRNPLLEQIQHDYPELFTIMTEVVKTVFPTVHVPDEEVGYLVMHIGAAIERNQKHQQRYRALIVCTSGIGSSKILATRIQKEIPEIEQLQNLSLFEVGLIPKSQYDLIISTIPLPIEPNEYLIVSPLLPKDDIQKIKYSVQNLKKAIRRTDHSQKNSSSFSQKAIEQLRAMQRYVNHTLEILDGFHYQMINNDRKSVPVIVKEMIDELAQQGFINNKEEVVRRLLHRERLGGLGIPGTDFAFFHTRTDEVGKPSFTIYSLSTPILLKSMDNHDIEIRKILLLIGPQSISSEGMEVLSEISSLLIEEDTVKRFETENEQEIVDYFSIRLQEFCYQKIRVER